MLSKYFNKRTMTGPAVAPTTLTCAVVTAAMLASGSLLMAGLSMVPLAVGAGYANKWHEAVTGKLIWTPRTPLYGL